MTAQNTQDERKYAWIYLFNLGFYVLPLVLFPYPLWEIAVLVVALIVFVGLYLYCFNLQPEQMLLPILAMYFLAVATTPLNPGSVALFSYVGFFVGFAYRWPIALASVIGIVATLAVFQFGVGTRWDLFFHYGAVIVITVAIFGRVERLRQRHAEAERKSQEEIERLATRVERERIARDLHDILGHTLSSIVLKSDLAQAQLAKQQYKQAGVQLAELSEIARASLSQVRQSVSGYKHGGLNLELNRLVQRLKDAGFDTQISGQPPAMDTERETAVVLALTELVTNIIRHSKGQRCEIHFDESADTYQIKIEDNGPCTDISTGNGLQGVQLRMHELGGSVKVNTQTGCAVSLLFPKFIEGPL
ncbi:two-component sensor histidine kinase [Aliidiomarina iranensis]|uniref:Two-component sensor histidine kinase n=1 Tax=Aliidiomarina iranensis TaxID=1434071 RepID=A0A432W261_9GAMM|nr:histidine kinase [Aliidiomarina iranensis]RUO23301.1 two-component sensor histidine kinase [Aliidiomarina iranensis]